MHLGEQHGQHGGERPGGDRGPEHHGGWGHGHPGGGWGHGHPGGGWGGGHPGGGWGGGHPGGGCGGEGHKMVTGSGSGDPHLNNSNGHNGTTQDPGLQAGQSEKVDSFSTKDGLNVNMTRTGVGNGIAYNTQAQFNVNGQKLTYTAGGDVKYGNMDLGSGNKTMDLGNGWSATEQNGQFTVQNRDGTSYSVSSNGGSLTDNWSAQQGNLSTRGQESALALGVDPTYALNDSNFPAKQNNPFGV
jgi:hypothetical protein